MFKNKNILIISAHSDDGIIGCRGFIAKCAKDNKIWYLATTSPPKGYMGELQRAVRKFGIVPKRSCKHNWNYLGVEVENRKYSNARQEILERFIWVMKDFKPDLVLLPSSFDTHQDHQVIYEEGFRAFKTTSILGYEFPWNNRSFKTDYFVELEKEHLDKKVKAIQCYKTQAHRKYIKRAKEYVYSLATVRGLQIHKEYAEAFEVIRGVV